MNSRVRVIQFDSRTNGAGHTVQIHTSKRAGLAGPAGTRYVTCSCPAGQFYWQNLANGINTKGCWAMQEVRAMIEAPTPRPTVRGYTPTPRPLTYQERYDSFMRGRN